MNDVFTNILDKLKIIFDFLFDKLHNIFDYFFDKILEKLSSIVHGFISFVLLIFGELGKEVVSMGDIVSYSFQKNGLLAINNFFYAFIGIVFLSFAVRYGIKLLLKLVDLIGNYIPFT